jgi:glycosyltransferase involved in cell wall biosynthesis
MRGDGIFISWETHTRSRSLSKALDVKLYEIIFSGNRIKRYFFSIIKTISIVRKIDPSIIIIQNPSIVLASIVILLFSRNRKIVMDAHNAAIYPLEGRHNNLNRFAWFLLRKSDLVIVTNNALHRTVNAVGANSFVLSDPIPTPPVVSEHEKRINSKKPEVIFICTWAPDEPYMEFLEAANLLANEPIEIKITGRAPENIRAQSMPANLKLMGFVSEFDYWELLKNAAVVVDLTTRENCLVCGAYEAAAVGVPCVISDSVAARGTFTSGYVFVENKASEIAKGILFSLECQRDLRKAVAEFRSSYESLIRQKTDSLVVQLGI